MHDNSMGIVPVSDPVDCPLCMVIDTLLSPYQAKKGVGESTQAMLCFVCNVNKEGLSDAGFGDSYNPKSLPLTGVQYVSMHCD